ncbi:MAG: N-acetyltransferase [Microbacterium sp.]|uniref:Mycothiol acetyltransferase n=1 Tax=Microbacterium ginsengisoli TaxID=400772 RepID=A0A0F0LSX0_9MICO|nr:GNAT family N-acetyltransferase [Microbacterium ginsengisoli]KJL36332.1 Mycothiol acetyltransferase [Microbacterium ginsengisoli]MAL05693.1 N-acetyltransferase [Microbacterium sp.]HAN25992.1 N-acetyltransferase [Microbacterium ginsengisoli]
MPESFAIRPATRSDGAFLADMVVEAANWRPGSARPRHEVLGSPEHSRYLAGWMRPGDAGFVATSPTGEPIGAAWYRMFPRSDPGFGYLATGVPELIIGVRPIWRAHGVGRALLQRLAAHAASAGYQRLSLSVERGNFAATLYRSEGFAVTQPTSGRDIMVKRLR